MSTKIKGYINGIKNGSLKTFMIQLKWIYSYGKGHAFSIVAYTLLGLTGTVLALFASVVSKDLVDIITGHQTGELLKTFCIMIGATLANAVVLQISNYLSNWLSLRVDRDLKAKVYDQIMETEWEELSKYHSGDLNSRWSGDVSTVSNGILSSIPNIIIYIFKLVSALVLVCQYDASFAVIAILSVPISLITQKGNMRRMSKSNTNAMEINAKMSSFTQESFSNMQNVKALDMVPLYKRRLRDIQKEYFDMRMHFQLVSNFNSILVTLTTLLVTYSTYGWGIYKVWTGAITYGTMTMFIALSASLSGSVQALLGVFPSLITLSNSAARIMKLTELKKEDFSKMDEVSELYENHKKDGFSIKIRNTSYAYKNGTKVFDNVSIEAKPRETVALIGPSGEGKTTMLRILLSLIYPEVGSGVISVLADERQDDVIIPISASARQLFAYVPQGNTMFSGTIAENMRNVKEDATDEEIIEALDAACAWEFVKKLPDGIHTVLQERGGGLSEGQSQRLCIARALLRQSPILLLDEATSALDMDTERRVLENISKTKYPRTCIVTTHKQSVMDSCDRIYIIKEGSITENA